MKGLEFIVWGCGFRGEKIHQRFEDYIFAYIDSDPNKIGTEFCGKKVISFEKYREAYREIFIVISFLREEWISEIVSMLNEFKISNYFIYSDCPHEMLVTNYYCFTLWEDYINSVPCQKNVAVYGDTFYSIILYYKLMERGFESLFLILPTDSKFKDGNVLKKAFPLIKLHKQEKVAKVLYTMSSTNMCLGIREIVGDGIPIEDYYDYSHKISAYYNPRLEGLRGKYNGEKCFIVANGPSLNERDLDILREHEIFSFGMNRIYFIFEKTIWRPNAWVCNDGFILEASHEEIQRIDISYKFIADESAMVNKLRNFEEYYLYHCMTKNGFSEDCSRVVYGSSTVTFDCLQLAVFMGFAEIYLLGVDCTNSLESGGHFCQDYYKGVKRTGIFRRDKVLEGYQVAKNYADAHGIKIYNATRGGALDVFERVDFEKLFIKNDEEEIE